MKHVFIAAFALVFTACDSGGSHGSQTLEGTVSYSGSAKGPLRVSVFSSFPPRGRALATVVIEDPVFPQAYSVGPLPPGRHFVLAIVDTNQDDGDRYHPTVDPGGAYGGYDSPMSVTIATSGALQEAHIDLLDPNESKIWIRRGYR